MLLLAFFLENSAFGYDLRKKASKSMKIFADFELLKPKTQVTSLSFEFKNLMI
jgi:hypothetical protein